MISPETKAEIRRLFYAEHHTVRSIADALGIHHSTVGRAIDKESFVTRSAVVRDRGIDAYLPIVKDVFEQIPTIRATRLIQILSDRGFKGGVGQVRLALRDLRQTKSRRAHLRVTVFPGEQGQCDWAHFGTLVVGKAKRKLSCFVMVLSYSRHLYGIFTFDQTLESFLRGHVLAFKEFGGVPRVILYDNLKAAVLERFGRAVRFNPSLLELAGHYHFRAEPCNPARGNEKGRVERAIGYIRTSFFPGRRFKDLDDANSQLGDWLRKIANVRPWPQDRERTVTEAFGEDRERLLALPEHHADPWHVKPAKSDKTCYIRFDLNDYSVPPEFCGRRLTLAASDCEVRLLDGQAEVARHERSYDRGKVISAPSHAETLLAQRLAAMPSRRRDTLVAQIPAAKELLEMLVARGEGIHSHLRRLYDLIAQYGEKEVAAAITEAAQRGTPRSESVAHILSRDESKRRSLPSIPLHLPDRPAVRDLVIKSHDLDQYDNLKSLKSKDQPDDVR